MSGALLYGLYLVLALIAGGLYLALPSDRALSGRLFWAGLVVGAAGLAGLAVYLAAWIGPGDDGRVFFVIFALLAIVGALSVISHRRPVYSAVYLVLVVLAVTGLCVLAAAEFLAAALVIVYGGAILVTYVFVIMLAQQGGEVYYDTRAREPLAAVIMGFALIAATTQAMVSRDPIALHAMKAAKPVAQAAAPAPGSVAAAAPSTADPSAAVPSSAKPDQTARVPSNVLRVGTVLMHDYMIAVQAAGILMLVAMVGAIAIARKRIDPDASTPYEQAHEHAQPTEPVGRHVEPFAKVMPSESR